MIAWGSERVERTARRPSEARFGEGVRAERAMDIMSAGARPERFPLLRTPRAANRRSERRGHPMARGHRPKRTRNEKIVIVIGILVIGSMVVSSLASLIK